MAAADQRAIAGGTPVSVLMDRAGRAVAWTVRRALDRTYGARVVLVCGKGNNGGDGLVAARVLTSWGVRATVFELSDGIDHGGFTRELATATVVVDAMFGTGFRGSLEGDAAWVAGRLADWPGAVVAVDIPSGVDGLTGAIEGRAVRAAHTVTFAARKPGVVFEPGRSHAGEVEVVDIGIAVDGLDDVSAGLVGAADVADWLPSRDPSTHKWHAGVMVVGGSGGMTGAPMLVSHAAMRAGAGIVWCALPGLATARAASGTEVITHALPADAGGLLASGAADVVLADADRFAALAVGPGLGGGDDATLALEVRKLAIEAKAPLVLDADGLNALRGDLTPIHARALAGTATVLTPHEGEYRRLTGVAVGPDRIAAARSLAAEVGAVVLLKGPGTVVAAPDGTVALDATGGPALATAGSGDVLTGIIAGFLARGADAFRAAAAGAWVHGRTAARLVADGGPGLVATDIVEGLPRTLQEVGVTA
jgi:NAD(P)H-hydrate epimerase